MIHQFYCGVYPRTIFITCDATIDEVNEEFPEGDTLNRPFIDIEDHTNAIVDRVRNKNLLGGVLIRFSSVDAITFETVTHESTHAADFIFDYIGAEKKLMDEPYAYLCGFIAKCCQKVKEYHQTSFTIEQLYEHPIYTNSMVAYQKEIYEGLVDQLLNGEEDESRIKQADYQKGEFAYIHIIDESLRDDVMCVLDYPMKIYKDFNRWSFRPDTGILELRLDLKNGRFK